MKKKSIIFWGKGNTEESKKKLEEVKQNFRNVEVAEESKKIIF